MKTDNMANLALKKTQNSKQKIVKFETRYYVNILC